MSLMRMLMWRVVLTTAACLCVALALALWRTQFDTDREARGSAQLALLVATLSAMQRVPADELPRHVRALREIDAAGGLRHLRLRILDAQGHELVALPPGAAAAPADGPTWLHPFGAPPHWRLQWSIPRQDGLPLTGILSANPASEQDEALAGVLGLLAIVCLLAAALLLGIYFALRRSLRPLREILVTIGQIEQGDTSHRLPAIQCDELDRIGSALNHLADALDAAQRSRRQLGARIQTLQEDERAQVALDLHDEFGQQIAGLRANLSWLQRCVSEPAAAHAVLAELDQECQRIQHGMRHLLRRLRPGGPGQADPVDLAAWLQSLLDGWHARPGNAVRIELACELGAQPLGRDFALTLYRMTQEALTNIARHAGATRARICIWREAQSVRWRVWDDGVGLFEPEQAMLRGRGLAGLRERAWLHGGSLSIEGAPGGGTLLQAGFPQAGDAGAA